MLDVISRKLQILNGLDQSQTDLIRPILYPCDFKENAIIFQQNQVASYLYILTHGEVVVRFKPYDGEELTIAHVYPEGVFGWSAALGRPTYTSSAYSTTNSQTLRIQVSQLQQFCRHNPKLGMIVLDKLASGIAERLRSTHDEVLALLLQGLEYPTEK